MTKFNERTNTLLYKKYISHTLFSKGLMFLVCERWVETRTDCYFDPSSSDYSSTSFLTWLVCSTVGHWGPKALYLPLTLNSASCPQLTQTATDSSRLYPDYIFVWHPPDSAVLPLIYTGTSLDWRLGRGSICYILRVPFLSHVWVFSRTISTDCRLKYRYSYFSLLFCFLVFVVFLFVFKIVYAVRGRCN